MLLLDIDRRLLAKRICIFISIIVFWILAALTASIPLNKPQNAYKQGQEYLNPNVNTGDTAWMIVATILGLMVAPLLAFFYGSVEGKSSSTLVYVCVVTVAAVAMLWILLGFSLCYGADPSGRSFLGSPSSYFMFNDVGSEPDPRLAPSIPLSIFALYELCFAILSPTVIACALNGRINMVGWLFFVSIWHLVVYCPIAHLVWTPGGWFSSHHIRDFSGGIVVNVTGGVSAAAAHAVLGRRKISDTKVEPNAPNVLTSLTLVWLTWFALNAGKAHAANAIAAQSVVNTMFSSCAAVLMWIFLDFLVHQKSTLVSIANALLVSLITMTPSSGYVTAGGAIVATIISVLVTYVFGFKFTRELRDPKQTLSVITLHGFTGSVGFFLTSIFSYKFVNEEGASGMIFGKGLPAAFHFALIILILPSIFIATAVVFFLSDLIVPIRSEDEFYAASDSGDNGSQVESSSAMGESTSTVEMFDLFHGGGGVEEEQLFNRSDVMTSEIASSNNDIGIKQAEKDTVVRPPDRVVERNMEESGYTSVSETMRASFRNELQEFITSKMRSDRFEAAI